MPAGPLVLDASSTAPDDGAVSLSGYFIVGLRPVKILRTEDGGLDCQALADAHLVLAEGLVEVGLRGYARRSRTAAWRSAAG